MKNETTIQLSDKLADAVSRLYGFEHSSIEFLQYSQNYVFRAVFKNTPLVVRVTESDHRTRQEILSELDWIAFLEDHGVNACGVAEISGRDVCETIELEGADYSCVLFEHARGRPITGSDLTPALFEQHGNLLGQLHRLTTDYSPATVVHRPQWNECRLHSRDANEYLLPEQTHVVSVLQKLVCEGMALPHENNTFGLVHTDIHYHNLFLDDGTLHLFDFDNCSYGFYANDVAKALYSSVLTYLRRIERFDDSPFESPLVDKALEAVWEPFWRGYKRECEPQPSLFEMLPLFFMLNDIREYVHQHRHGTPERDPRIKAAFRKQQERIERGILPVQFDFMNGRPLAEPVKLRCTTR